MTKLYYHPHSSAAASFIAAVAAGVHIEVEQIDFATKKTTSGADFFTINPKGNVPALVLDDGTVLNEGSAVLQYIADQVDYFASIFLVFRNYHRYCTPIPLRISGFWHCRPGEWYHPKIYSAECTELSSQRGCFNIECFVLRDRTGRQGGPESEICLKI